MIASRGGRQFLASQGDPPRSEIEVRSRFTMNDAKRTRRVFQPGVDSLEGRPLLSAVADVMAPSAHGAQHQAHEQQQLRLHEQGHSQHSQGVENMREMQSHRQAPRTGAPRDGVPGCLSAQPCNHEHHDRDAGSNGILRVLVCGIDAGRSQAPDSSPGAKQLGGGECRDAGHVRWDRSRGDRDVDGSDVRRWDE